MILFPAYAGGKFIANCLCLSKYFVPAYPKFDFNKIEDYDYRLATVCKSLPPSPDYMKYWLYYEFDQSYPSSEFYKKANSMNLRCIKIAHEVNEYELLNNKPHAIVKLICYNQFRDLAYSIKKTNRNYGNADNEDRYNTIKGPNWPDYYFMDRAGFDSRNLILDKKIKDDIDEFYPLGKLGIDVHLFDQSTIFNKQTFLNEMKKLYSTLDLDDFNEEATSIFYTRYATLHNI